MNHPPLSREEQQIAARHVYCMIRLLADPDHTDAILSHTKGGMLGGTCELRGVRGWFATTSKGVGWSETSTLADRGPFPVFVTWTRLVAHVESRRTVERQEWAADWLHRSGEHARYAPVYPSRHSYPERCAELDAYWRDVHMPEWRALRAEEGRLAEALLPLLADDEPADLLELLAAES